MHAPKSWQLPILYRVVSFQVDEYLDEFNYELAQRFCQRALDLEPNNVRVLQTSGVVLLETDDLENAKRVSLMIQRTPTVLCYRKHLHVASRTKLLCFLHLWPALVQEKPGMGLYFQINSLSHVSQADLH